MLYPSRGSSHMQRDAIQGLWIHSKYACIESGAGWHICGANRHGYHHNGTICRECSNLQINSSKRSLYSYHANTMAAILAGCQLRDLIIGIRTTFWSLHSWMQIRPHHTLPCGKGLSHAGSCHKIEEMVPWAICYAGKNIRCDVSDKTTRYLTNGG